MNRSYLTRFVLISFLALLSCLATGVALAEESGATASTTAQQEAPLFNDGAKECGPAVGSGDQGAQPASSCGGCTSAQNSCSSQGPCNVYCQQLVGESGFCNTNCGCCVCPGAFDPPDDPGDPGLPCTPVCRCDGVPGPQGQCANGCRQVNCIGT